ncbi:MAG: V-type proton ATPase subunit E [Oscillospiraceae bacterium]|jgi:vacuolar-type H+-ATPase subunit E/Vma4|nr:V-type proton ATPase subunit E [Oscillospiraceae bacterium]
MTGLDKIISRIAADARADAEAIDAEARKKSDAIKADYDARAKAEYERLMEKGKKELEQSALRLRSAAELDSKKRLLAMKQDAVTDVLAKAQARICALPPAEYSAFLAKLALDAVVTGEEELIFNARDKAAVSKAIVKVANDLLKKRGSRAALTVSDEIGSFEGGLMVKQGDISVNCTVEMLVSQSRDALAAPISDLLFSE